MGRWMETTILIGITGGLGSGKSTVSRFWARYMQLPLVDIDMVCRKLLAKGEPGWQALRRSIDSAYFNGDGELDRRRLRVALFSDGELRRRVNALVHPLAAQALERQAAESEEPVMLVDVPLLFEADWQDRFHGTVVVYADMAARCRRAAARDGISPDEAVRSMAAQMPLADKALLADHVVDNSGCWLAARMEVVHLARLLAAELGTGSDTRAGGKETAHW